MKSKAFLSLRGLAILFLCAVSQVAWAEDVSYIERSWDGTKVVSTTKTVSATLITGDWNSKGSETMTLERGKWYYIPSKTYNGGNPVERKRLIIPYQAHGENGDIHIILGDGAELRSVITFQGYKYTSSSFENGTLHIYAQSDGENMGKIIANASNGGEAIRNLTDCAGIGGTDESDDDFTSGNRKSNSCGTLYIHGGDIYAKGNNLAAGIGGGDDGNGGNIYIYGGKVRAYGGSDAAGIGGGEDGNGGKLYVYGGEVFADGTDWAAGIGGGEDGDGAEVHLLGGSVTAWAGEDAGEDGGLAIGGGDSGEGRGSLSIGDNMMVHAGQSSGASNYKLFSVNERVPACFYRPYAKIEPCTHGGSPSYVINGEGTTGTHSLKCSYCKGYNNQAHTFGDDQKCTVCGAGNITYTINMWVPDKDGIVGYLENPLTVTVAQGKTFVVPTPSDDNTPYNMTFVGWVRTGKAAGESYLYNNETLVLAGEVLTMDGSNLTFKAKYKNNDIVLGTADDNMILEQNDGKQVNMVTIQGRILYKDGSWNTICLPFDYNFTGNDNPWNNDNPDVRMLQSSAWDKDNQVLTLNFTEQNKDTDGNTITTLKAGTPYLIRWDTNGQDMGGAAPDGLVFYNVTINKTKHNVYTDYAAFSGTFSPIRIYTTSPYKTELYMGASNTLYYPTAEGFKVGAYRAYFTLSNGLYADENGIHNLLDQNQSTSNAFNIVLNFGDDDVTGIENTNLTNNTNDEAWYDLSGRRLNGKPTTRGIYINNGKKIVVK